MADPSPVKILIVDDNAAQRMALSAVLSDLEVGLVEAASGRDALRRLLEQDFALILLDVNMPGLDGFETAALIRAHHRTEKTPIIFITANSDDAHAARGYSLRAVDYILTPVQPDVLRTKVSVFLDLYRKTEEVTRQREALWRYARQLQELSRASLDINAAQSIDTVLRTMTDSAAHIIGASQVVTSVRMPGAQTIHVTHLADKYHVADGPALDASAAAALLELQQPIRLSERTENSRLAHLVPTALFPGLPLQSWLAVPLRGADGRNIGLTQLAEKESGPFTAEDEDIVVQLAQMASIAIGNLVSAEAREANRLKDEFLSVLSHELRTPLHAMMTWLSILRRQDVTPPMLARGLDVIDRSARAQAQLIEDLLDVSRIIRGHLRLEAGVVDLSQVVELALETLKPAAAAKTVRIDFSRSVPDSRIVGDAARLQQVVWNLASNAIKFTPDNGRVEVHVGGDMSAVWVRVTDSGPGIPAEFIPHVFERFRQADSSAHRAHGGLGLGLAIVHHLAELHGGTVQVENGADGGGARFTVTLPRSMLPAALSGHELAPGREAALDRGANVNGVSLDGIRVMLVEDQIEAREAMTTALRLYGAEVVAVDSMGAALAAMAQRSPDVLLSDVGLPGNDGYLLIEKVRAGENAEHPRIPAAALTAYVRPEDRTAALHAGFDMHLAKPVEPLELARVVKRLVKHPKQPG